MFSNNKSVSLRKEVYKLDKINHKRIQQIINYTHLLYKLKMFTEEDKNQILDKIPRKSSY